MDRSDVLYLVSEEYKKDEYGQDVAIGEVRRKVFCSVQSIGRAEWNAASQAGLNPELEVTMFAPEYKGEHIAELQQYGKWFRFKIYRTYLVRDESLELYLTERVGISDARGGC